MTKPAANRSVPAFITAAMDRIRTLWLLVVHPDTWTKSIKLIDCLAQILLTMAAALPEHGVSHRREPPVLLRILYQQLGAIPKLSQPVMHNWDAAYSILLLETCNFSALRLHQIRTFDYVPHDS